MPKSESFKWKLSGGRLCEARRKYEWTQQQVGEKVGVRPQMVWYWEAGRSRPNPDRLLKLASLFGVSVEWLLGEGPGAAENRPVNTIGPAEEVTLASVSIIGAVSAGGMVEAWQEDLGTLEVPSGVLKEAPRAFALRVYGNSLASEWIYEGAIVVVDPDAPFVDGKIYAVSLEGGEVAARRIFEAGRRLKLVTGDGHVDEYTRSRVNILGRVRWSFREH